ncbi:MULTISPECIES: ASCH domain-containing protein [Vagococcus]|uniref:ASCH domain-containing protein n=1 Tax=Vagococcus TaxID=2737 RepID=UPI002FCA6AEC
MEIIQFGGTKKEQTELAQLVLSGEKYATSSLKELQKIEGNLASQVGDLWEIRDGENKQVCLVEVTEVYNKPFGEIEEAFAVAEGDGTYINWFNIHNKYYGEKLKNYGVSLDKETILECVFFKVKK